MGKGEDLGVEVVGGWKVESIDGIIERV